MATRNWMVVASRVWELQKIELTCVMMCIFQCMSSFQALIYLSHLIHEDKRMQCSGSKLYDVRKWEEKKFFFLGRLPKTLENSFPKKTVNRFKFFSSKNVKIANELKKNCQNKNEKEKWEAIVFYLSFAWLLKRGNIHV